MSYRCKPCGRWVPHGNPLLRYVVYQWTVSVQVCSITGNVTRRRVRQILSETPVCHRCHLRLNPTTRLRCELCGVSVGEGQQMPEGVLCVECIRRNVQRNARGTPVSRSRV